jgi:hypothetical protein
LTLLYTKKELFTDESASPNSDSVAHQERFDFDTAPAGVALDANRPAVDRRKGGKKLSYDADKPGAAIRATPVGVAKGRKKTFNGINKIQVSE